MRIWLLTIGEPLPFGTGADDRLHRTGMFARLLAGRGHQVTWWTSAFDHFRKTHLCTEDAELGWEAGARIVLLHGCGYRRNVSLGRLLDHRQVARKFALRAEAEAAAPDVIVSALPAIELCSEAVRYGRNHSIPVVLDMRDMWPDIFAEVFPKLMRPLARLALTPLFRQAREACRGATAILGITDAFVEWGLRRAGRRRNALDRAFPLAYATSEPPAEALAEAERFWDSLGILAGHPALTVCFVGAIGRQLDLRTVIEAARMLHERQRPVRFVVCGNGDRLPELKRLAGGLANVILPGWIHRAQIHVLLRRCQAGLDPLPDRYDFRSTINNKAIEYFSAGLPVISSPTAGVLAELLARDGCGLSYRAGAAEQLARILETLQERRAALAEMSRRAVAVFQNTYCAETVYEQMAALLEEVAAAPARPVLAGV